MADNQIIVELVTKTPGASSIKIMQGNYASLDKQIGKMVGTLGKLSGGASQAQSDLKKFADSGIRNVRRLRIEIERAPRTRGAGGRFAPGLVTGRVTGFQRARGAQALERAERRRNADRLKAQRMAQRTAETQRRKAESAARRRRMQAERSAERAELARKQRRAQRAGAILATAGFTTVAIGTTLKTAFQGLNFQGIFGPVMGQIGGIIGTLFGQTIGAIFTDIFKAGGELAEALLTGFSTVLQTGFRAIGSIIETVGISIISVALTGPIGILIGVLGGFFRAAIEIFSGLVKGVVDIIKNLLRAVANILSALARIVKTIFKSIATVVLNIWRGLWKTIKNIAQFTAKAVIGIVNTMVNQVARGFAIFVETQKQAAVTFGLVANVAGQTTQRFIKLARTISATFGLALPDVQKAIFDTVSAGFRSTADANLILKASSELAVAGGASLAASTSAVITVLNSYKLVAKDAARVTEILFTAQVFARATVEDFARSLANVSGFAAAAGLSFKDLAIAIATITIGGLNAQRTTLSLNRLFESILLPTGTLRKKTEALGLSLTKLGKDGNLILKPIAEMAKQFDGVKIQQIRMIATTKQARQALVFLKRGFDRLKAIGADFEDTTGTFRIALEEVMKTFSVQFDILRENLSAIRQRIAEGLTIPFQSAFREIVKGIQKVNTVLQDSDAVENFFEAFRDFAQPVIDMVLIPIEDIIKSITKILKEGDFAKIFEAEAATKFRDIIKSIIEEIINLPTTIKRVFQDINVTIKQIRVSAKAIGEIFKKTITDPEAIREMFNEIGTFIKSIFSGIGTFLINIFKEAFSIISGLFMGTIGPQIFRFFGNMVDKLLLQIIKGLSSFFKSISFDVIKRVFVVGKGPEEAITKRITVRERAQRAERLVREAPGETFQERVQAAKKGERKRLEFQIEEQRRNVFNKRIDIGALERFRKIAGFQGVEGGIKTFERKKREGALTGELKTLAGILDQIGKEAKLVQQDNLFFGRRLGIQLGGEKPVFTKFDTQSLIKKQIGLLEVNIESEKNAKTLLKQMDKLFNTISKRRKGFEKSLKKADNFFTFMGKEFEKLRKKAGEDFGKLGKSMKERNRDELIDIREAFDNAEEAREELEDERQQKDAAKKAELDKRLKERREAKKPKPVVEPKPEPKPEPKRPKISPATFENLSKEQQKSQEKAQLKEIEQRAAFEKFLKEREEMRKNPVAKFTGLTADQLTKVVEELKKGNEEQKKANETLREQLQELLAMRRNQEDEKNKPVPEDGGAGAPAPTTSGGL